MTNTIQPGIRRLPPHTYSLRFGLRPGPRPTDALDAAKWVARPGAAARMVTGFGAPLLTLLDVRFDALRPFVTMMAGSRIYPETQAALWLLLQGEPGTPSDPGALVVLARTVAAELASAFEVLGDQPAYTHREGRDLAGYRDGTENPNDVLDTVLAPVLPGATFAFEQRWVHDLAALDSLDRSEREQIIGRRIPCDHDDPDTELEDLPETAHILRTKQEEAGFMYRRSQAFGTRLRNGLQFIAYASSLDTFEVHLRRMIGLDGPADALERYSRPDTGGFYLCPGVLPDGSLDLSWMGA